MSPRAIRCERCRTGGDARSVRTSRRTKARTAAETVLQERLADATTAAQRDRLDSAHVMNTLQGIEAMALRGEQAAVADAIAGFSDVLRDTLDCAVGRRRREPT